MFPGLWSGIHATSMFGKPQEDYTERHYNNGAKERGDLHHWLRPWTHLAPWLDVLLPNLSPLHDLSQFCYPTTTFFNKGAIDWVGLMMLTKHVLTSVAGLWASPCKTKLQHRILHGWAPVDSALYLQCALLRLSSCQMVFETHLLSPWYP